MRVECIRERRTKLDAEISEIPRQLPFTIDQILQGQKLRPLFVQRSRGDFTSALPYYKQHSSISTQNIKFREIHAVYQSLGLECSEKMANRANLLFTAMKTHADSRHLVQHPCCLLCAYFKVSSCVYECVDSAPWCSMSLSENVSFFGRSPASLGHIPSRFSFRYRRRKHKLEPGTEKLGAQKGGSSRDDWSEPMGTHLCFESGCVWTRVLRRTRPGCGCRRGIRVGPYIRTTTRPGCVVPATPKPKFVFSLHVNQSGETIAARKTTVVSE